MVNFVEISTGRHGDARCLAVHRRLSDRSHGLVVGEAFFVAGSEKNGQGENELASGHLGSSGSTLNCRRCAILGGGAIPDKY